MSDVTAAARIATPPSRDRIVALGALAATLGMLLLYGLQGFETLHTSRGDNDSLLRLVQVRDLLAGQGWFDPMQYRMGLAGGFAMHWSRLADAPIAAIILAAQALGASQASAEAAAMVVWPSLLFAAALALIMRMATRLGGEAAMLPALVVGAAGLHGLGVFAPGSLDHHNLQIVLALALMARLMSATTFAGGAAGGAVASAMLGIGMETVPIVAAGGLAAAALSVFAEREGARVAAGFGAGFAIAAMAIFLASVGPQAWTSPACDAFSIVHLTLAIVSGAGLCGVASTRALATPLARMAGLAVLGAAVAAIVLVLFPQCLADPYAGLDPMLRTYWLDAVSEAQPVWNVVMREPLSVPGHYALPFLALLVLAWTGARRGVSRAGLVVAMFLVAAVAVSVWQVRGALFANAIAFVVLAAWIARLRVRALAAPGAAASIAMALAWLVSFSATWSAAAVALSKALPTTTAVASGTAPSGACHAAQDYARLAALPPSRVFASSNLGSAILRHTPHSALAGPYHRNVDGNLVVLRAMIAPADAARPIVEATGARWLAFCPGNAESRHLARAAPDGLAADLIEGRIPAYLVPLEGTVDGPLRVYEIR
jgi:hypothetical protein